MTNNTANQTETKAQTPAEIEAILKEAKGKNLTFPIMNGKRENIGYVHPEVAKNPLQFIGNLIKTYSGKVLFFVDFPRNKTVCIVPAAGTYGEKERALMAHKNFLAAVTEGMERNDQITDKSTLETLGLYKAKGWKFTTFTKIGILTVAAAKLGEVVTAVNLVKSVTMACPELKQVIENNSTRKEIAAEINKNGLEAGLKLAKEKSYKALPAIVK